MASLIPSALFTAFQLANMGKTVTGLSGLIPYQHKDMSHTLMLKPIATKSIK